MTDIVSIERYDPKYELYYTVVSPLIFEEMEVEEHNHFSDAYDVKRFIDKLRDDGVKDEDIVIYKNETTTYYNAKDFMNA